jgi:hypothetical protein
MILTVPARSVSAVFGQLTQFTPEQAQWNSLAWDGKTTYCGLCQFSDKCKIFGQAPFFSYNFSDRFFRNVCVVE